MASNEDISQITEMLYAVGNAPRAQEMAEEFLQKHPNHTTVRAILGHSLASQLKHEEAHVQIIRILKDEPRNPKFLTLLAELSMNTGRYRDALGQYDKALKYLPDFDAAIGGKAETYLRMGKPKQALRVLKAAGVAVDKLNQPSMSKTMADAFIRTGQEEEAITLLEHMLPLDPKIPLEQRRALLFSLATAFMKLERFDEAFDAFINANGLVAGRWTPDREIERHEHARSTVTRQRLEAVPKPDIDASNIVLIVGLPRCGSTLTEQIIDAHPLAHGAGESTKLPEIANSIQDRFNLEKPWPLCLDSMTSDQLTELARDYIDHLSFKAGGARLLVDKQLGNFNWLDLIQVMLPGAKVIHCMRHPMDLGLSNWTNRFAAGQCAWSDTLEDIAGTWHRYEALMDHWRDVCTMPMLEIRYEDLVADTEGLARSIIEFCGLEWDPACLRFWETKRTVLTLSQDQVRQPIYTRARGRHAAWGDRLAPLRAALGPSIDHYEQP
ncbi:MAG: sulfotransferase [Phycisphaerales bacterium]|nr:sulfotransferase [Phycisphaerales bacterium]